MSKKITGIWSRNEQIPVYRTYFRRKSLIFGAVFSTIFDAGNP